MGHFAPVDEVGDEAVAGRSWVAMGEFPFEEAAIGKATGDGDDVAGVEAGLAGGVDAVAKVCGFGGPGDEFGLVERLDPERQCSGRFGLTGVGGEEFDVGGIAEIEDGVVGAEADMLAAVGGSDAGALLKVVERGVEVGDGVYEVVQHYLSSIAAEGGNAVRRQGPH